MEIGDKVKIVNYGHAIWISKDSTDYKIFKDKIIYDGGDICTMDIHPELVGQQGVIQNKYKQYDGSFLYALEGIRGKSAWYEEQQLEKIC